jgi:hypothetical protein
MKIIELCNAEVGEEEVVHHGPWRVSEQQCQEFGVDEMPRGVA